jgi:putative transposase
MVGGAARPESAGLAERTIAGYRRRCDGILGGAGGSVSGDRRAALLVLQARQRVNALPESLQAKAKAGLQAIFMAATRAEAIAAFGQFTSVYGAKYPKAVEKFVQDKDSLLAFYDFPAEHWQHIRTTNPIESTFVTVRHRTTRSRNCLSRATFLGLAFKLMEEEEKTWRKIRDADKIRVLLAGMPFKDGVPVKDNSSAQQTLAA